MTLITLLCLGVLGVAADSHTLRYVVLGVSEGSPLLPEFSIAAYIDDSRIYFFRGDTGQFHSPASWMSKEMPEYWERQRQRIKIFQSEFQKHLQLGLIRFNQTEGFHSAQWLFNCELRDDGTTAIHSQMGYDEMDVIFLDGHKGLFIPTVPEAVLTTQDWNSPEKRWGEILKYYLDNECIEEVKIFSNYAKDDIRKGEVKVWGRLQPDGLTRLHCLVYGFHPRAVDVKWVRNEVDHVDLDEMSPILPNPDGTYQIRVSAEVFTSEGDTYSCHVDHSSLGDEILIVKWEPNRSPPIGVIVGAIIVSLLITAVIIGVSFYIKNKRSFRAAENSDATNDSSINPHM